MKNKIFRSIGVYTSISILSGGLNFFFISYYAKILSLENTGMIGLVLITTYITVPLIRFGTTELVGLNVIKYDKKEFIDFFNILISFVIICLPLIFLFTLCTTLYFKKNIFFLLIIIVFSIVRSSIGVHDKILILKNRKKTFAIEKIRTGILTLLFGIIFINFNKSWTSYFSAIILAEIISVFFRYCKYYTLFNFKFDREEFVNLFQYGLPFVIGLGGAWALNQFDKLLIESYYGLEILGGYTLAFQIGILIRTFNTSIANSMYPIIYSSYSKNIVKKIQTKFFIIFLSIGVFIFGSLSFFVKYFFSIVYGNNYNDFKTIIIIIGLAFVLEGLYKVGDSYLIYKRKNYVKIIILYFSALVGLVSSLLLMKTQGFIGPAYGVLIAYFTLLTLTTYYSNNLIK